VFAAVFARVDRAPERKGDGARFVGAQALDVQLAVALEYLFFRVPVADVYECTELFLRPSPFS
jgi:hypothetical protein